MPPFHLRSSGQFCPVSPRSGNFWETGRNHHVLDPKMPVSRCPSALLLCLPSIPCSCPDVPVWTGSKSVKIWRPSHSSPILTLFNPFSPVLWPFPSRSNYVSPIFHYVSPVCHVYAAVRYVHKTSSLFNLLENLRNLPTVFGQRYGFTISKP